MVGRKGKGKKIGDDRGLSFGFCVLRFGFCVLRFGFCVLRFAFWVSGSAFWVSGSAFWVLGFADTYSLDAEVGCNLRSPRHGMPVRGEVAKDGNRYEVSSATCSSKICIFVSLCGYFSILVGSLVFF